MWKHGPEGGWDLRFNGFLISAILAITQVVEVAIEKDRIFRLDSGQNSGDKKSYGGKPEFK